MLQSRSSRWGFILLLLAAVAGFALALYAWLAPLTGVTGTIGALGVAIANVALAVFSFILRACSGRRLRLFWTIIILLMLLGVGFASLLLHQWVITAAMAIGLIGLIAIISSPLGHDKFARV